MSQTLIILIIVFALIAISCATLNVPTYKGEKSDHFDGKKFFNPDAPGMGDFKELMTFNRKNKRAKWYFQDDKFSHSSKIEDFNIHKQVRYFHINHASVLVQMDGINILTDPVYFKRASPFSFIGPKRYRDPGIPFEFLPRIDIVVISHDHYDHLDVNTLKKLKERDNPMIYTGLGLKSFLNKFKITNVTEMDWNKQDSYKGIDIIFTPAVHWSNRAFSPRKTLWGGYLINGSSNVFFAGDTAYGDHFTSIKETFGSIDLALIPIGAYIPRSFMLHVHMDPQQALQAHIDIDATESFAIHWGTFQLTHEAMFDPIEELEEACKENKIENFHFEKTSGIARIMNSNGHDPLKRN